ncbi:hypothetical protein QE152_g12496 [Popillia japonica]|uniref:Uncharacterized protein n=1 Tax=Popillia japonica TaxID=7064 RepID=A0AAW1LRD5_POPJA
MYVMDAKSYREAGMDADHFSLLLLIPTIKYRRPPTEQYGYREAGMDADHFSLLLLIPTIKYRRPPTEQYEKARLSYSMGTLKNEGTRRERNVSRETDIEQKWASFENMMIERAQILKKKKSKIVVR